jgi:hypothetical protein
MSDERPTPDANESDAQEYRVLQAKRIIIARERLGSATPRRSLRSRRSAVNSEIASHRDAFDEAVAQQTVARHEAMRGVAG